MASPSRLCKNNPLMTSNQTYAELLEKQGERLQKRWRSIIDKYSKVNLDQQGDLIDLHTGEIVEDNGHLESVSPSKDNVWNAAEEDEGLKDGETTEDIEGLGLSLEQNDGRSSVNESSAQSSEESLSESSEESLEDSDESSKGGNVSVEFSEDELNVPKKGQEQLRNQRTPRNTIKESTSFSLRESLPVFKKSSLDHSTNDLRYDKLDKKLIVDENSLTMQDNLILINKSPSTPFSSPLRKSPEVALLSPTTPTKSTPRPQSYFSTPRRTKPNTRSGFSPVYSKTASPTKRPRSSRNQDPSSPTRRRVPAENELSLDLSEQTRFDPFWTDSKPTKSPIISSYDNNERDTAIDDEVIIDN